MKMRLGNMRRIIDNLNNLICEKKDFKNSQKIKRTIKSGRIFQAKWDRIRYKFYLWY